MSTEKEYFARFPKLTVLPFIIWAFVIGLVIAGVLYASRVQAEPVAKADGDNGAVIILYDEPCELKDAVTNLPYKAEWKEEGKVFAGCWALHPAGAIVSYWSDKTVALIPRGALQKVVGA